MNTNLLMISSALFMGITGILLIFAPEEILSHSNFESTELSFLFLQILGALYFSFAVLNWMAKGNIIGGIYSKPVAMGNFAHFMIGGLSIIKAAFVHPDVSGLWIFGIIYAIFAILYAVVAFGNPLK